MTRDNDNTKFDNIDPELRRMIEDRTLKTIVIENAAMRLKNGKFTIRAEDLLPKEKKPDEAEPAPGEPLTPAQRQKKHYEKLSQEGWKKTWVPPKLIAEALLLNDDPKDGMPEAMRKLQNLFYQQRNECDQWKRRAIQAENRPRGWLSWLFSGK